MRTDRQMASTQPGVYGSASSGVLALLTRYRELTWEMTKREIRDRYAAQLLGTFWAVGHPVFMIGIHLFIFAGVLQARLGTGRQMPLDYGSYILCGLIPWLAFQDSMNKGTASIVSNASLVRQVVFPLEVLPVKSVLASLVTQLTGFVVLIAYVFIRFGSLHATYLLLPVLVFFQALAMIGVSYVLAAIGTFFRDTADIVQVFGFAGIYLMPVVYLPQWVPPMLRPLLYANPFSYMTWCYRDVCYYGRFEHPWAWPVFVGGSVLAFYGGFRIFARLRIHFGNAL